MALGLLAKQWPAELTECDVVLVDPAESQRIHEEFLSAPDATDVITFMHGELIICPAVAEQQRHIENLSLADEVFTYIIHGCLHLCGYDDHSEQDFLVMKRLQTKIRQQVLQQMLPTKHQKSTVKD